ncbi:zinc finger protein 525-like [Ctenocephalides felis]|uniref:zinc finger protein 525-like n=1 Tax=Ctenocephalides felis TaxID=7515 RepID=UPI000E6E4569|nr:zinc finger protein 525-like [Ctenocephalides felis]
MSEEATMPMNDLKIKIEPSEYSVEDIKLATEKEFDVLDGIVNFESCDEACLERFMNSDVAIEEEIKQELIETPSYESDGDGEIPFVCNICNKIFTTTYLLDQHICDNTIEQPLNFKESYNLKQNTIADSEKRPHTCVICDKSFKRLSALRLHMGIHSLKYHMRSHTGEYPYKCVLCDKKFTRSSGIKTHMRIHTGERPYKCKICDKTFAVSGALNKHMRIHTGERPYKCEECDYAFRQWDHLKSHRNTHKKEYPYKCEICDEIYSSKKGLVNHKHVNNCKKLL